MNPFGFIQVNSLPIIAVGMWVMSSAGTTRLLSRACVCRGGSALRYLLFIRGPLGGISRRAVCF